ncbi:kinase-like domain-containing protein [Jimgerdemannia flammicorona]|uniref:Kinase-like domain-containing protein n=1 Tax=Jimgerdemannia flammicorona TaxID=994334 RepID=A0A433QV97_9FUNG|nr:kinase-like domain-containing protein [Jimgerdemannia flammicorona]
MMSPDTTVEANQYIFEGSTNSTKAEVSPLEDAIKLYHHHQLSTAQLSKTSQARIRSLKLNFPDREQQLKGCLHALEVSDELSNYLVYIPFERFKNIGTISHGRFSTTLRGTVSSEDLRGFASSPNHDMPERWEEENKRSDDNHYDYQEERYYAMKTYNRGYEHKFKVQVIFSVLLTTFSDTYDAVSPIGFTRKSDDDLPYIIMEITEAGNLGNMLQKQQERTWTDIWRYAVFLASGLSNVHKLGIIHGNLHPENVVIAGDKSLPYIIGFGLSRQITNDDITLTEALDCVYDRLDYLPPEMFAPTSLSKGSDIYCLGTLLWQLVTTVSPRGTIKTTQRADGLREDLIPGVPKAYENIYSSCWNDNPQQRPTAEQIVKQLLAAEVDIRIAKNLSPDTTEFISALRIQTSMSDPQKPSQVSAPLDNQPLVEEITINNAIETDEELFLRIRKMTEEEFVKFGRENQSIVQRYKEYTEREKTELDKKEEELNKLEKQLQLEIKRAFPWKWLRRAMGFREYAKDPDPQALANAQGLSADILARKRIEWRRTMHKSKPKGSEAIPMVKEAPGIVLQNSDEQISTIVDSNNGSGGKKKKKFISLIWRRKKTGAPKISISRKSRGT